MEATHVTSHDPPVYGCPALSPNKQKNIRHQQNCDDIDHATTTPERRPGRLWHIKYSSTLRPLELASLDVRFFACACDWFPPNHPYSNPPPARAIVLEAGIRFPPANSRFANICSSVERFIPSAHDKALLSLVDCLVHPPQHQHAPHSNSTFFKLTFSQQHLYLPTFPSSVCLWQTGAVGQRRPRRRKAHMHRRLDLSRAVQLPACTRRTHSTLIMHHDPHQPILHNKQRLLDRRMPGIFQSKRSITQTYSQETMVMEAQ